MRNKNNKNKDEDEALKELTTLRDYIRWGVSQFNLAELSFAQGMPTALDEAIYLCLFALHLPPDFSETYFDCHLTLLERQKIMDFFRQRIEQKKPVAYITNEAWFAGLSFVIDERALIPRSPIAEIIQQQFSPWVNPQQVHHILDLCTGSGCIAVACAYAFEQAQVDASDISTDALELATINTKNHNLSQRVHLIKSDIFSAIEKRYDIIVSNPPYVSQEEMQQLPEEFDFEPSSALVAGVDGLDIVISMLKQAQDYLTDEGVLVVEVGYSKPALEQVFPEVDFFWFEFEFGGEGVFMLTRKQLLHFQSTFEQVCRSRH